MTAIDVELSFMSKELDFAIKTRDDRIIAQSKYYLTIFVGLKTCSKFIFDWIDGAPASKQLIDYLNMNLHWISNYQFTGFTTSALAAKCYAIVNAFDSLKPENLSSAAWYQLLAMVAYLVQNKDEFGISSRDNLISVIRRYKSFYNPNQCMLAISVLSSENAKVSAATSRNSSK